MSTPDFNFQYTSILIDMHTNTDIPQKSHAQWGRWRWCSTLNEPPENTAWYKGQSLSLLLKVVMWSLTVTVRIEYSIQMISKLVCMFVCGCLCRFCNILGIMFGVEWLGWCQDQVQECLAVIFGFWFSSRDMFKLVWYLSLFACHLQACFNADFWPT